MSAPEPVLVPTHLQTELVLRCHQETDCELCVRVVIHLTVHGEHVIHVYVNMSGMGMIIGSLPTTGPRPGRCFPKLHFLEGSPEQGA